ncbi:MAG: hypothetical protein WCQ77_02040 [Planctomycetota bacterium]
MGTSLSLFNTVGAAPRQSRLPGFMIAALLVPLFLGPRIAVCAQLPTADGQVWKTYDIGPFVTQAGADSQRHVIDWVLQETGSPQWHGSVAASLSADATTLRCYHTPQMQARVAEIAARFVGDAATPHRFSVRVLGVGSPAWRSDVRSMLRPIPAATPGVQAWILSREEAAVLVARLRSRSDCQELPTGKVLAANGIPAVLTGGRKRPYLQDMEAVGPNWQPVAASCDEGMAIDVHPLISRDGTAVEAVIRCRIDQVERMAPVTLTPPGGSGQRVQIEVPQMSAVRIGERFRWPAKSTLVIGLGLVPWPVPGQNKPDFPGIFSDAKRTDVVVLVEPRLADEP